MVAESSKSVGDEDEDGDRRSTIERRVVCVLRRRLLFAPFAIYLYRSVCFYQLFHYRNSHTLAHSLGTHTHTHTQQDQVEEKQTNSLKRNCTTRSQILLRNLLVSFSFVSPRCTQGTTTATTTTNTAFIFVVELQILLMWHTKHITHAACETYFQGFPKTNRVLFLVHY